jgi:threonyl-tRNA synthetase
MLQRVYGTAWRNKEELEDYLHRLEEAEKRDHRKIGKTQDLPLLLNTERIYCSTI